MSKSTFDAAFQWVQELAATFKTNEARYLSADKVYSLMEAEIAIVENAQK